VAATASTAVQAGKPAPPPPPPPVLYNIQLWDMPAAYTYWNVRTALSENLWLSNSQLQHELEEGANSGRTTVRG
jgi:hypothetical protein